MLSDSDPYLLSYCPFGKTNTKYILTWYLTRMTSKQSVYMKTYLFLRISLKKTGGFFLSLKKNPTFSNIFPCTKHILNTFKLRTLCARLYLFVIYTLFAPIISTSIHRYENNSPDIKVLMKVIRTETFNVGFTSQ